MNLKKTSNFELLEPPAVGDIKQGWRIGLKNDAKHIYQSCRFCGKLRWVKLKKGGLPESDRCIGCRNKIKGVAKRNANAYQWKGGYSKSSGYLFVRLNEGDFFYSMANTKGVVRVHRLIMAKHLKRCLQTWEAVHHKNQDKLDNRITNLILTTRSGHNQYHQRGYEDGYLKGLYDGNNVRIQNLEKRITLLEAENELLKVQVKGTKDYFVKDY